jgi:hypothetical protein
VERDVSLGYVTKARAEQDYRGVHHVATLPV